MGARAERADTSADLRAPRCPGCRETMRDADGDWECTPCSEVMTPTSPIRLPKLVSR